MSTVHRLVPEVNSSKSDTIISSTVGRLVTVSSMNSRSETLPSRNVPPMTPVPPCLVYFTGSEG